MTKQLDLTKPVQTKRGLAVRIICTDAKGPYAVIGLELQADGAESIENWTSEGKYYGGGQNSDHDLVNVPQKVVRYVNVYGNGSGRVQFGSSFLSAVEADAGAGGARIARIRVEFEEGQFDA